jgi:hypothetical protein
MICVIGVVAVIDGGLSLSVIRTFGTTRGVD